MFNDLVYRLRALLGRDRMDADLDEELRLHVEREADAYVRGGMDPDEARRHARLAFGGAEQVKEACRDARGISLVDTLVQDVRYAVRTLRHNRGYAGAAILTLTLGIGLSAAIFSVVNGLLLRPLPVREPHSLFSLERDVNGHRFPIFEPAEWDEIQRAALFGPMCASQLQVLNTATRGVVDNVMALWVTGGCFETLGVPAVLGRTLTDADDHVGGGPDGPVAVISHGFWQRRYGGAADAIGRSLTIEGVTYTIIGITTPEFFGVEVGRSVEVFVPLDTALLMTTLEYNPLRGEGRLGVLTRLRPDQTLAEANAALRTVQPAILAAVAPPDRPDEPVDAGAIKPWSVVPAATGAYSGIRNRFASIFVAMLALAGLVLLIVCVSVANLSLARAAARRHEMAVRRALGASRLRLARQVFVESLLLSGLGAVLGLAVSSVIGDLLVRPFSVVGAPAFLDLSIDWRVLGAAVAASVGTAVLFGLVPALRASRAQPHDATTAGGRGHVGERRLSLNHALIVAQVGISLALVVAAGLFVRTFVALATMDLGFDRDRIVVARIDSGLSREREDARAALYERVRQAAAVLPGVDEAVSMLSVPVSPDHWLTTIAIPGEAPPADGEPRAFLNAVSPGWFDMFGTTLLAGRGFGPKDQPGSELVAVVNETFARQFAEGRNLVGTALRLGSAPDGPQFRIVGLVSDSGAAIYYGLRETIPSTVYFCIDQMSPAVRGFAPPQSFRIAARPVQGDPLGLVRALAATIEQIDPDLKMSFRTMASYVDGTIRSERLAAMLAALFGSLALLLAGVGLYGVTAYVVSRRRTEIGIRIALGASAAVVVRAVLLRVVILVTAGIAIGAGVSVWASRLVGALLFGLQPQDPLTFVAAVVVLVSVAVLAGWLPARRAARLDPAAVLRSE